MYVPTGQMQLPDPAGDTAPPAQSAQTQEPAVVKVSVGQGVHGVAAIRSTSACPSRHDSQAADPSAAKVPTAHSVHFIASDVCDAVPAGQVWHRPCSSFHVPAAHVDEQQAAYGSIPTGVVLLSPLSISEPVGQALPAVDQSAQLMSQHDAERGS